MTHYFMNKYLRGISISVYLFRYNFQLIIYTQYSNNLNSLFFSDYINIDTK